MSIFTKMPYTEADQVLEQKIAKRACLAEFCTQHPHLKERFLLWVKTGNDIDNSISAAEFLCAAMQKMGIKNNFENVLEQHKLNLFVRIKHNITSAFLSIKTGEARYLLAKECFQHVMLGQELMPSHQTKPSAAAHKEKIPLRSDDFNTAMMPALHETAEANAKIFSYPVTGQPQSIFSSGFDASQTYAAPYRIITYPQAHTLSRVLLVLAQKKIGRLKPEMTEFLTEQTKSFSVRNSTHKVSVGAFSSDTMPKLFYLGLCLYSGNSIVFTESFINAYNTPEIREMLQKWRAAFIDYRAYETKRLAAEITVPVASPRSARKGLSYGRGGSNGKSRRLTSA